MSRTHVQNCKIKKKKNCVALSHLGSLCVVVIYYGSDKKLIKVSLGICPVVAEKGTLPLCIHFLGLPYQITKN